MEMENNDHILVKDLLRFVLFDYYPAVNWKPNGIFVEENVDSPFSSVMKLAMKLYLDSWGGEVHSHYDEDFPCKEGIDNEEHFDMLLYLKSVFESKPFENAPFHSYLCMCAEYAALSYLYGANGAPHLTLQVICIMMQQMRESGKITKDIWTDFEKYCESYVQAESRRWCMKKPISNTR